MKRILCLCYGMLALWSAYGQSFIENVYLTTEKGIESIYAKGDTVKVYATVEKETPALLSVFRNGKPMEKKEVLLHAGKNEVFRNVYDEASAIMVRLANPHDKKNSTTIGTIVAPEDFRPGFDMPSDFRRFWKKQLKIMRREKMEVKLTTVEIPEEDRDKYVCYDLEINCLSFRPVRGYLAMPRNAGRRSLPIAIYAHSAGVLTTPWTKAKVRTALNMAKKGRGAIALDINAHGILNGQEDSYYEEMEKELHDYSSRHITDHETFYFRGMFLRLVRALDFLCSLQEWDGKRVLITGTSQGGAQSAALAGLDKRVKKVVVDVPAMWDMGGKLVDRSSGWPKPLERDGINSPAVEIAPYYDASSFMRYYKGELVINVGLIDLTCPPAGVWSVFNVCPSSSKTIHPCAWKAHNGKLSMPSKEGQDEKLKAMAKYLDSAIEEYLQ